MGSDHEHDAPAGTGSRFSTHQGDLKRGPQARAGTQDMPRGAELPNVPDPRVRTGVGGAVQLAPQWPSQRTADERGADGGQRPVRGTRHWKPEPVAGARDMGALGPSEPLLPVHDLRDIGMGTIGPLVPTPPGHGIRDRGFSATSSDVFGSDPSVSGGTPGSGAREEEPRRQREGEGRGEMDGLVREDRHRGARENVGELQEGKLEMGSEGRLDGGSDSSHGSESEDGEVSSRAADRPARGVVLQDREPERDPEREGELLDSRVESEGGSRSGRWVFSGEEVLKKGMARGVEIIVRELSYLGIEDNDISPLPSPQQRGTSFNDALAAATRSIDQPPEVGPRHDTPWGTEGTDQPAFVARADPEGVEPGTGSRREGREMTGAQQPFFIGKPAPGGSEIGTGLRREGQGHVDRGGTSAAGAASRVATELSLRLAADAALLAGSPDCPDTAFAPINGGGRPWGRFPGEGSPECPDTAFTAVNGEGRPWGRFPGEGSPDCPDTAFTPLNSEGHTWGRFPGGGSSRLEQERGGEDWREGGGVREGGSVEDEGWLSLEANGGREVVPLSEWHWVQEGYQDCEAAHDLAPLARSVKRGRQGPGSWASGAGGNPGQGLWDSLHAAVGVQQPPMPQSHNVGSGLENAFLGRNIHGRNVPRGVVGPRSFSAAASGAARGVPGPGQGILEIVPGGLPFVPQSLGMGYVPSHMERETAVVRKRLVRLATAIEQGDMMEVQSLYRMIKPLANVRGTALERVVHYCLHSLMLRLTGMGPAFLIKPSRRAMKEVDQSRIWYMSAFPLVAFTGVVVTGMLLGKLMGKRTVHVIAMGQTMMPQWAYVLRLLAEQPGQPLRHFRLTWVDTTLMINPGLAEIDTVQMGMLMSQRLKAAAKSMGVGFGYEHVALGPDNLSLLYDVRRRAQDTVVFATTFDLLRYPAQEEKAAMRTQVLEWMRFMEPATVAIVELEVDGCSRPLLTRVKAYFHHLLTTFQAHDGCATAGDSRGQQWVFESVYYGKTTARMIACEGGERYFFPSTSKVWVQLLREAGFVQEGMSSGMLDGASEVVKHFPSHFGLSLSSQILQLTWEDSALASASCWTV